MSFYLPYVCCLLFEISPPQEDIAMAFEITDRLEHFLRDHMAPLQAYSFLQVNYILCVQ